VQLVHEMGSTIASERASAEIFRAEATAVLQSVDFNEVFTDLPIMPTRILGCQIFTDNAARIARAAIVVRNPPGREMPIWVWDQTNNLDVDFSDNGAAVALHEVLVPQATMSQMPLMTFGTSQPRPVDQVALRGRTTAFGAGDVTITMLVYAAFPETAGISSVGLPYSSW